MTALSNSNIDSTPDASGVNPLFIWGVTAVAALGGLLFGFDTAIISGALPFLRAQFELNAFMQGWVVSSIYWVAVPVHSLPGVFPIRSDEKTC